MGSVAGSTALAIVFVEPPRAGEATPFVALFAGLVCVALVGVVANGRIAERERSNPDDAHPNAGLKTPRSLPTKAG